MPSSRYERRPVTARSAAAARRASPASALAALDPIWEIPSAVASFLLFKATRRLVRAATARYFARNPGEAERWRVLSAETLARPIALPVVMTSGPRWNTHAVVANVGPLQVKQSLAIRRESADRSSPCWTIAIHAYPRNRLVARFASADAAGDDGWDTRALEAGRYVMVLRYYDWQGTIACPAVVVDGVPVVAPMEASADVNHFYRDLWKRRTVVYRLLHAHIFTLVRFRRWLPPGFVTREVLPIGNPETAFVYEALWPGTRATLDIDPSLLDTSRVFYTVYGRDSFPLEWRHVVEPVSATAVATEKSLLLVRVHANRGGRPPSEPRIRIEVG